MSKQSDVIQEFDRIYRRDGCLRPATIVEEARSANSPLHSRFTWDDTAAAHQYRLHQARMLINVTVKLLPTTGSSEPVQAYVSLTTDRHIQRGYREVQDVLTTKELRAQFLADALRELHTFQTKYAHLSELAQVFEAIHAVEEDFAHV